MASAGTGALIAVLIAVVAVVVVPSGRPAGTGRRAGRLRLAGADLADAVRAAAGVDVAAVLVTSRLPVDVRHQSKVDRAEVARRAARALAGARVPHRP